MSALYLAAAVALFATFAASLVRIVLGPTEPDRMMAAQIFGTTGVAFLLLLARALEPALIDVALVFAPLAAIAAVAFVRRAGGAGGEE